MWYLSRLGTNSPTEYQLNEGDTLIGRNKSAQIITLSDICSRNHCTITKNQNEISIKNHVSRDFKRFFFFVVHKFNDHLFIFFLI